MAETEANCVVSISLLLNPVFPSSTSGPNRSDKGIITPLAGTFKARCIRGLVVDVLITLAPTAHYQRMSQYHMHASTKEGSVRVA